MECKVKASRCTQLKQTKVKLKELRNNDPSLDLTKVDFGETENIWVSDYWDGAISGMIEYQNELY